MQPAPAKIRPPNLAQRLQRRILHDYFVRIHMGLILAAVTASGVLTSKGLLELGVHSLRFRYPVAVLGSSLVFLLLVRVWIWYVSHRQRAAVDGFDLLNFDPGGGGSANVRFGGGDSGGGGASGDWEGDGAAVHSSGGGSALSKIDLDLGDDGGWILVLLAALVLSIFCCGGYLIYAAPQILPEAACQAVLASALTRVSKEQHHGWMRGVLRSTAVPFLIVLVLAGALGWVAHRHCPQAARLVDALRCRS